jgi:hypothetical protein
MRRLVLATAAATLLAAPAGATSLVPYSMTMSLGGDTLDLAALESAGVLSVISYDFGAAYSTTAPLTEAGEWRLDSWSSYYESTPRQLALVDTHFDVTNLSTESLIFSVKVEAPVELVSAIDRYWRVGIVLTADEASRSATFSTVPGTAMYTAWLDGAAERTLRDDPYSRGCAGAGCSIWKGMSSWSRGGSIPEASMGITLQFALSPGSSAELTGFYLVRAVPEPTTALLLGGGLAALGFSRLRRAERGTRA